jgi:hypothetical protein
MTFAEEQECIQHFDDVLTRVDFPEFYFVVSVSKGAFYFQIECNGRCNVTDAQARWKSRKWLLSPHMTDGEIVQTAFLAVLTALEHEARERFKYRGVSIFDPHYDVEELVRLRGAQGSIKERDGGSGGA